MTDMTSQPGFTNKAPVAGGIASRVAQGGHQPVVAHRRRGSTRYLLRHAADITAIWFSERFEPTLREQIMVAVASANSCRQCSYAHREWALAEGLSEADLAALEGLDEEAFDARTWAAIAWAQATARCDLEAVPQVIDTNFRQNFSPREQADIDLIVRVMYWCNEISNAVDAAWSRLKGQPVPGSRVLSEINAVVLYVLAVPILFVVLGVKQRRRPLDVMRGMGPFFRQFQPC
jgi:AhpD family alkylhydroperoxidase